MSDRIVKGMLKWTGGLELQIPPYLQHPAEQVSPGDVPPSGKPTHCCDKYHSFQDYRSHWNSMFMKSYLAEKLQLMLQTPTKQYAHRNY